MVILFGSLLVLFGLALAVIIVDKTKTIVANEIDLIPISPFLDLVHMLVIVTKGLFMKHGKHNDIEMLVKQTTGH